MGERGAISLALAALALAALLVGVAGADLAALLVARARAHAAAEAAALAAVVEQAPALATHGDPPAAARAYAERNGAVLLRCACEPGAPEALVEVGVAVRLLVVRGWFGREARAAAAAEVDEDVLTYRPPE